MNTNEPLGKTDEALKGYLKHCEENCNKAQKILREMDDPSPIAEMAREVIVLGRHLGQFEHTLGEAYQVTKRMAEYVYEHPRLLLELKQLQLELVNYAEAIEGQTFNLTDDLRMEIAHLKSNILAADEKRWNDIHDGRMLKSDPVEWTMEYEDVIDEADKEAYSHLDDCPRGMGFCFGYWAEKRNALARRGIEWRSPQQMNPGVLFD